MPFEIGNTISPGRNARPWQDAIKMALKERENGDDPKALRKLANKLLKACDNGDITALKELGDRLDGKAQQFLAIENRTSFDDMNINDLIAFNRTITRAIEAGTIKLVGSVETKEVRALPTL